MTNTPPKEEGKPELGSLVTPFRAGFFIVWLLAWRWFIFQEFGAVFVLVSGFIFVYFNLDYSGKAKEGYSAYSVFNKDGYKLPGECGWWRVSNGVLLSFTSLL